MNLTSKIRIYSKAWFAFYNKDRHSNERRRVCDHATIWALEIIGEQACIKSKPQPKRATVFTLANYPRQRHYRFLKTLPTTRKRNS
jgi:hypothetical protein